MTILGRFEQKNRFGASNLAKSRTSLAGLLALDNELGAAVEGESLGLGVELANNLNFQTDEKNMTNVQIDPKTASKCVLKRFFDQI